MAKGVGVKVKPARRDAWAAAGTGVGVGDSGVGAGVVGNNVGVVLCELPELAEINANPYNQN